MTTETMSPARARARAVDGERCWCGLRLVRNHDEAICFAHGTVVLPARAYDLSGVAPADPRRSTEVQRQRRATYIAPFGERDRRILAGDAAAYEWEPGMPLANQGRDQDVMEKLGEGMAAEAVAAATGLSWGSVYRIWRRSREEAS